MTPIVNTHVHIPPNFSAFRTPDDVIFAAQEQQVRAVGISNFYDYSVYGLIRSVARELGVVALFGMEFITLVPELAAQGIRINDPNNPGRMYLTGKGIDPFRQRSVRADRIASIVRKDNDMRAHKQVAQLAEHFGVQGFDTRVTPRSLAEEVAGRAGVPVEWVSLQERHVAMGFQEALFRVGSKTRDDILDRVYGTPSAVDIDDPVALQGELRSRLMKAGAPDFVPDSPLSFSDAYAYIVDMGGIPCYPILADGTDPVCPFEESIDRLAAELIDMDIYAAELIPNRNLSSTVDRYVERLTSHGIIVMAGTEHNTQDMIPLDPRCEDGPLSAMARDAFYEGTCIVAAHAVRHEWLRPGYVDESGHLVGDLDHVTNLINEGNDIIEGYMQ